MRAQAALLVIVSVTHLVSAVPSFILHPTNQTKSFAETAKLPCQVANLPPGGTVQWFRDKFGMGTNLSLPNYDRYRVLAATSGHFTLMISNVQLVDDAEFYCQIMASGTNAAIKSNPAILTVQLPPHTPVIEGQPVVEVIAQQPANLTCSALFGKPAASISWRTNGILITGQQHDLIGTKLDDKRQNMTSLLSIDPRRSDQGREYECQANNPALYQPLWTRVRLEVLYAPEVTMTIPPVRTLKEFGRLRIACEANANPSVITWRWYRETELMEGATSNVLQLAEVLRDLHDKSLVCEASNSVGRNQQSYKLNIEYGPRFTGGGPQHVAADVGDDAVLTCLVDGNPRPAVLWSLSGSNRILSSENKLQIYGVTEPDFGIYQCKASVIGFDDITMDIHLLKKGPPVVVSPLQQSAQYGDTGVVECVSRCIPKPTHITWTKDGKELRSQLDRYDLREEPLPDGVRSIIEILNVQDEDYGDYNCTVENSHGTDTKTITFSRKKVIPLVYILIGVLLGFLVIVAIIIALCCYHRRKAAVSESDSESSESNINKVQKDGLPSDYKVPSPIDAWRTDIDSKYYRHSAEYDELSPYPPKEPMPPPVNGSYDYRDGYGNHGMDYPRSDYGTYPGAASRGYDPRYGSQDEYGRPTYGSEYGTYHRPPPLPLHPAAPRSDYGGSEIYGPPAASLSSRLSTNV